MSQGIGSNFQLKGKQEETRFDALSSLFESRLYLSNTIRDVIQSNCYQVQVSKSTRLPISIPVFTHSTRAE